MNSEGFVQHLLCPFHFLSRRFKNVRYFFLQEYEGQIQVLQEKVEQQSMLSSMVQEDSVSEEESKSYTN